MYCKTSSSFYGLHNHLPNLETCVSHISNLWYLPVAARPIGPSTILYKLDFGQFFAAGILARVEEEDDAHLRTRVVYCVVWSRLRGQSVAVMAAQ